MRCFKCQQYGHHISRCPRGPICAKCGTDEEDHSYDTCSLLNVPAVKDPMRHFHGNAPFRKRRKKS